MLYFFWSEDFFLASVVFWLRNVISCLFRTSMAAFTLTEMGKDDLKFVCCCVCFWHIISFSSSFFAANRYTLWQNPNFCSKNQVLNNHIFGGKIQIQCWSRFHQNWIFGQKLRFCISVLSWAFSYLRAYTQDQKYCTTATQNKNHEWNHQVSNPIIKLCNNY